MTILLYDRRALQERSPKHLTVWKVWHIILYVLAAVFGITNYVFLHNTMELVNGNCILFPRQLEFHSVEIANAQISQDLDEKIEINNNNTDSAQPDNNTEIMNVKVVTDNAQLDANDIHKVKREINDTEAQNVNEVSLNENVTTVNGNETHRLALDVSRTLFAENTDCLFAEYMPLLSTVFAVVWLTMFTMCPSGGRVRTGLTQPWRILSPALFFALVMVALTGHSFTLTNGGIHAFCAAFSAVTNSTTCSAADPYIELSWTSTSSLGTRTTFTRASSAGAWASWACAAALLLARCLAAPDFRVRRTTVYISKDPQEKVIPYLKKSHVSRQSNGTSPDKRDNVSIKSEPTVITELVSASVDQGDSAPTSLLVTPVKMSSPRNTENIEMTYTYQERNGTHR